MPKTVDLTGQKFGKLTVLERTQELQDGYYVWKYADAAAAMRLWSIRND